MSSPVQRGRLKIFLGYAAGVGKTYQMLTEAHEAKRRGVDVVIGYFEPHGRKDTIALTVGLEAISRKVIEYRGSQFEEMDADAILHRHPQVALIDELPHTNVPGSARPKRWQDVHRVLDAGIDVLTTMNIQHVESLNDQIWQSAGVRVRETIPDWVVKQADEMVMVDLTPRALLNRFERGVVYPPERARAALENFFKEPTLVALRELAIRLTAHAVESRYPRDQAPPRGSPMPAPSEAHDRLLLIIGPDAASAALIRRGRRVADYLHAECLAVYVAEAPPLSDLGQEQRDGLQRQLSFARGLQIETQILEGRGTAAEAIVSFARQHGVTQIFVTRQKRTGMRSWLTKPLVQQIVDLARDMQVTIVADRSRRRGIE